MKRTGIVAFILVFINTLSAQDKRTSFSITHVAEKKELQFRYGNNLLTSYCYYDSSMKPILFPVNTVDGIAVTRGYPFQPKQGERTDHPHHSGSWLNYESVNGLDFWNNSTAIPADKAHLYGTIRHKDIVSYKAQGNIARMTATASWQRPDNFELMKERTTFNFKVDGSNFIIDRITTLSTNDTAVYFRDVKDGFFAIRVARELEMPSTQADVFVDVHGNRTGVKKMDNTGVTGLYESSTGLRGDSVWGTRAAWVQLTGRKEGKDISIVIFDHPANVGYPSYWHARGYGLFAVNPFGQKIFSNGKESLDFSLPPHSSITFRYRMVISNEKMHRDAILKAASAFSVSLL
jgi:hypothetical protein